MRRKIIIGIAVALVLNALVGYAGWSSVAEAGKQSDWVSRTQAVLIGLDATLGHLLDAETGARGFALTGHELFLDPYFSGIGARGQDLTELRRFGTDSSFQIRFEALTGKLHSAYEFIDGMVAARRENGKILDLSTLAENKRRVDAVRAEIRETRDRLGGTLEQREQASKSAQRVLRGMTFAGRLVGFTFLALAGFYIHREVLKNAALQQRVDQRTAALEKENVKGAQIQNQLRESEEMHRLMLDGIQDYAVYRLNPNGEVASWNTGAARIKGYPTEEILGRHFACFYTAADRLLNLPEKALAEAVQLGRHEDRGPRVRKDGSEFWSNSIITPIYDENLALRGYSKVVCDITQRKQAEDELGRAEQALRAQTRLLHSILDSMGEGLIAADASGKFVLWNPAAESILGELAPELAVGDWTAHYGIYRVDGVTRFPATDLPLARALRGQEATSDLIVRNARLGRDLWVEATARPMKDEGAMSGAVVAFRDITERKAAEREIAHLNAELEQRVIQRTAQLEAANKELEAFTYSISHDLRAPLRHISGFTGILLEDSASLLDEKATKLLHRIQAGTHMMGQMVDELLNLARVARKEPNLQVTGLNAIVQEVLGMLKPEIEGREIEWRIADLPFVECDPTLIRLVFQNLISNALKYSRPRSPAVIEIGKTKGNAIFVRDNGVGFSMKYADKLFGVFQRLHRAEDFEGTGVGLATVQRIIQKHGGRIWADAELDRGAAFYFTVSADRPGTPVENEERLAHA